MTARKCDRCKSFYDIDSKGAIVKIVNYDVRVRKIIESDLCPDCTEQLNSWIKNKAEFFERKEPNE